MSFRNATAQEDIFVEDYNARIFKIEAGYHGWYIELTIGEKILIFGG